MSLEGITPDQIIGVVVIDIRTFNKVKSQDYYYVLLITFPLYTLYLLFLAEGRVLLIFGRVQMLLFSQQT
jgi:hypothetical protein